MIYTQPKDTAPVALRPNAWVKVAESRFPSGAEQHAMLYANLKLLLKPGEQVGKIRVKARRRGTEDDTAYQDYTVIADDDAGNVNWLLTHTWFGGRPSGGYLDWYIQLRRNVVSGEANAGDSDYGKGMNN